MLCTFTSVLIAQLCLTLCNPKECSPPGSSIHGILQARVLEWVAISFSRGSSQPRDQTQVSHIAGRRVNLWATREVVLLPILFPFYRWGNPGRGQRNTWSKDTHLISIGAGNCFQEAPLCLFCSILSKVVLGLHPLLDYGEATSNGL